jgi:hypothetical protein
MAVAGATLVAPAQPRILAPEGYREFSLRGGAMEVQESAVVKFVSAGQDDARLHTAVFTDPVNCSFPPITLFTAVDVQVLSNLTARRGCGRRARCGTAGGLRRRSPAPTAGRAWGGRSRSSG